MSYGYTVITYGGGRILTEIFNGISAAVGSTSYLTMIGIASLFAFAWVACETVFKQSVHVSIRWFIGFFLIYNLLLVPKVTVHLEDKVDQTQINVIDNVPWGLAEFASDITEIFSEITTIADSVYSLPDDLRYTHSGTIMASSLVNAASQFSITDPAFANNMNEYMKQCVFYDLLLGKYTTTDLFNTTNLWSFITDNASPARAFRYNKTIMTCKEGVVPLTKDWNTELKQAGVIYGSRFFKNNTKDANNQLLEYLPIGYSYLTGISQSAEDIMQQNMVKNAIDSGVINNSGTVNANAALEQYAYARAQQNKRALNQVVGEQAGYWLPIMKIVFEAILFGSFLFLAPLMLMPFGFQIFKNYIFAIVWVESWAPLYAILNLVMTMSAKLASEAAVSSGQGNVLTMMTLPGLQQANLDISYLAGYFSLSIPMISYYITKGGAMGFMSLAQYMGGAIQSSASGAVAEETTGNLSFGNTSFGNHSAFNTNANHFDTNARVFSGGTTTQMPGGSQLTVTPDGSLVMNNQGAISSLGTTPNFASSLRASFSQQAEQATANVQSDAHAYSQSMSQAVRDLDEMGATNSSTKASGESFNKSDQAGLQQSANTVHSLVDKFAKSHNLSHDASWKILADASVGRKIGPVGGKVDVGGGFSSSHRHTWDDAKDFVQQSGFNDALDSATRAVHDQSFRTSNESSSRLSQSISSSLDSAEQARHDISTQLQQSESFRQMASVASDDASNVNSNASQAFFNWMLTQSAPGGTGPMGLNSVEHIMADCPDVAKGYAEQFVQTQGKQFMQEYMNHSGGLNSAKVQSDYQKSMGSVPGSAQVAADHSTTQASVLSKASAAGLDKKNFVDTSARDSTNQFLKNASTQLNAKRSDLSQKGSALQGAVQQELD